MSVKIPEETIKELFKKLKEVAFSKKKTLKQLQSSCGSLDFYTRTLPAGRASTSRLYLATAQSKKPLHLIKVTKEIYEDLLMLKTFVEQINDNSFIFHDWISNCDLELYTDSAGGGFQGMWCLL